MLSRQTGLTIIEAMITLLIIGILASVALPGFSAQMRAARLKSVAEDFNADLILARNEAIRINAPVYFNTQIKADGSWCYGIGSASNNAVCDCTTAPGCDVKAVNIDVDKKISVLFSNLFDLNFRFEPKNGVPRDIDGSKWAGIKTLAITNPDKKQIYISLGNSSRSNICTGSGKAATGGYTQIATLTEDSSGHCL